MSRVFTVDLRTLALFRVCFGFILLADLVSRSTDLVDHYTDRGVLPTEAARTALNEFGFSLHLLNGSVYFQASLFVVAGVFAIALILGYRTRLSSMVSWILLASLNHRNYHVLQSSDTLMLCLLFWSMFLPLGARFSVDGTLNKEERGANTHCSFASAALVIQVLSVYFFGALLKTSPAWVPDGNAVYFALHYDAYASRLGIWAGGLPVELLRYVTYFVYYVELFGSILILSPWFNYRFRLTLIPLLVMMHIGFALLLAVGNYPYLSITSLMVLIPGKLWDDLGNRRASLQRPTVKFYYDGPCDFCRKVCLILRELLALRRSPVLPADSLAEIRQLLDEHNSWVIEDSHGQRYVRWPAMVTVFEHSPIFSPVSRLLGQRHALALGERLYASIASNRDALSRLTGIVLPYRANRIRLPLAVDLIAGGLLFLVLLSNVTGLKKVTFENPWTFARTLTALSLNQNWTMFTPQPGNLSRWLFVEGKLADGAGHYASYRWRKYFHSEHVRKRWPQLGRYYCLRWNERHAAKPVVEVTAYLLIQRTRRTTADTEPLYTQRVDILGYRDCK